MVPVTRCCLPPLADYLSQLQPVWESGQITNNGAICRQLQELLKIHFGLPHLELVANGTLALQLAIKALGLKGEIITTPYSYVATTHAILWEGCDPVFVDIDEKNFGIDPELIEAAITENTAAILATHVYGYPCDVRAIQAIAEKYRLRVIYDAAHAFGVKFRGQSLLHHGDCSALSFHATKLFHTAEGGAVVCRDEIIARRISLMKKFGHIGEDEYLDIGINAKMSELHAAMGLAVWPQVGEIISARREVSSWYDECLAGSDLRRPGEIAGLEYNYAYYPVVFPDHGAMLRARQALMEKDIFPRRYFFPALNTLPFLKPERQRPCPVAESIAARVLSLPLFPGLEKNTVEGICGLLGARQKTAQFNGPFVGI